MLSCVLHGARDQYEQLQQEEQHRIRRSQSEDAFWDSDALAPVVAVGRGSSAASTNNRLLHGRPAPARSTPLTDVFSAINRRHRSSLVAVERSSKASDGAGGVGGVGGMEPGSESQYGGFAHFQSPSLDSLKSVLAGEVSPHRSPRRALLPYTILRLVPIVSTLSSISRWFRMGSFRRRPRRPPRVRAGW